jgi:hypothetical protein
MTRKELQELTDRFREKSDFIRKSTIDSIVRETSGQKEARIKRLLLPDNYNELFNYYFGKDTPIPMADCDCAWYHTTIYKDLYYNPFNTVFNLIFRGGAKSTHANMGYPFALKEAGVAKFFLTVGANEVRAAMLLQDLQVQFEQNQRIIDDFGIQKVYGSWAEGIFETTDRCTFMALGIDQPFRGLRQNGVRLEYVSIDDVEDKKRALNRNLTKEYVDKVTGDIQGAFSTKSERTIINNNFFVANGFVGGLLEKKGFNPKKIDTKQNTIRKEKYASLYLINLSTKYFDAVKVENSDTWSPSWPERFSKTDCLRKIEQYQNDKETLSGEFYNTPINVGKRIKESMIKMVKPLPLEDYLIIIGNWDLAYSDAACYKGMAMIGVKDIRMTVLDVFCRQTDIAIALDYHFHNAKRVSKINSSFVFYYDASVAQESVYDPQWFRAAIKHKSFLIPLPQKTTVDKFTKIDTTLVGALVAGILDFSDELENNPDWEESKRQMLNFEKGNHYPVDFPDALTDAILKAQNYLQDDNDEPEHESKPIFGKKERGDY